MVAIVLDNFGGMAPRTDASKLPDNAAQIAQDVRLHAGALRGWRRPTALSPRWVMPEDTVTIYYEPDEQVWFSWATDVNVVLGPISDPEANRRYYYTGDGIPKKTDSAMALLGGGTLYPRSWLKLGVPAPDTAPSVVGDFVVEYGTVGDYYEDRAYIVTYVSEFSGIEEESAPSPPTLVTIDTSEEGSAVSVAFNDVLPTEGYNITKRRVYRTNGTNYFYVGESSTSVFIDDVTNAELGEACTTIGFDVPPDTLSGLVAMPNGFLAGFSGNEIMFSEPYKPHAWPTAFRYTVPEKIVALQPFTNGCYILTEGHPYTVVGTYPDSMSVERILKYAPCLAKRTVATDGIGVIYVSHNGVMHITGTNVQNVTQGLFTQDEWTQLKPATMHGVFYDERYMLWYDAT